ncbi:MAG: hypothetical protein AAFY20_18705 [Cyanobacteria bacterium J06639_14]
MIISFGYTRPYLPPHGPKDTTRRIWKPRTLAAWQKAFDQGRLIHTAVDKCLAYGGQRIGTVTLLERPFLQVLHQMPASDLIREGGMGSSVDEYIEQYFKGNASQEVAVIRFKFQPLEVPDDASG